MAPKAGLEPATNRLTAGCSTTELLRNANIHLCTLYKLLSTFIIITIILIITSAFFK